MALYQATTPWLLLYQGAGMAIFIHSGEPDDDGICME
jgi:hypothetical protein